MSLVKEGWIEKKGQTFMAGYKKRWLVLYSDQTLKYYEDNYYEILKGSIDISETSKIENSREHSKNWRYGFEIATPSRNWFFSSRSENDRKQWISSMQSIIDTSSSKPSTRISYNKHKRLKNIAKEQKNQNNNQHSTQHDHQTTIQPLITHNAFDNKISLQNDNDNDVFGNGHANTLDMQLNIANENINTNSNILTETFTKSKFGKDYPRITSKSVTEMVNKQMINLSIHKTQQNEQMEEKHEVECSETFCIDTKINEMKKKYEHLCDDMDNQNELKCFCGANLIKKSVDSSEMHLLCEFCGHLNIAAGVEYFECDHCDDGINDIHGSKGWRVCTLCCYQQLIKKYYNTLTDKWARRIGVSIVVERVSNICTKNHSFRAKLAIKHSWKPSKEEVELYKDKPTDFQPFWRPQFSFPNLIEIHDMGLKQTHWSTEYTILRKGESDSSAGVTSVPYLISGTYWIDATFWEIFELDNFPFDCQDLTIKIQLQQFMSICEFSTPFEGEDVVTIYNEYSSIAEWNIHPPKLEIVEKENGLVVKYSLINLSIKLERTPQAYLWRIVLFLSFLTVASLISFVIDTVESGADRIVYLITLLLTAVAYQFAILQDLPKVPYLTLMDKYILQTFIFIFVMLIETAIVVQYELEIVDQCCNYLFWVIFIGVQILFIVLTKKAKAYEIGKLKHCTSDMDKYCHKKRNANKLLKIRKFG